jgi:ABC-2 type transport system ATP-binding protein
VYSGKQPLKAIEVEHLSKFYPGGIKAVDDISFDVQEGEVWGFLGPNGAGKTTTIRMITTLAVPTSGSIKVFGLDVSQDSSHVRSMLSYVPQAVSVDGDLTAYENLLIFSKLFDVKKEDRRGRIAEALDYMGLTERADDLVKHFSGGMMRRLEIAESLVNRPKILFLDEPSIGLDPASRLKTWGYIKKLNSDYGVTIFITTHDMEEADELCDRLAIMNQGKIAVSGVPDDLKRSLGGDLVTVKTTTRPPSAIPASLGTVTDVDEYSLKILSPDGDAALPEIIDCLRTQGVEIRGISLSTPSLDDVFLKYTNVGLETKGSYRETREARKTFQRRAR